MSSTEDEVISSLVDRVVSALDASATGDDADLVDAANAEEEETTVVVETLESGVNLFTRPNGEDYHGRKLGEHSDVMAIRKMRTSNINVLFTGPPGTGKTALIEAAFADSAYEPEIGSAGVYTIQCSGDTELADFIGGYVPNGPTSFEWVDGPLLCAMQEGKPLYVDEIALCDPKVLAGLYGVMDGRGELRVTQNPEKGIVKCAPGFYVIAACNPNAPGARMSEALVSRFSLQVEITTDYALAKKLGVPGKVVTAASNLQSKVEKGELGWAPQLRELLDFKRVELELGRDIALANLVQVAPELDRAVVADVLSRAVGATVTELKLS